jgi:hypothetical protein
MADYQLTAADSVIRTEDGACIPADPANRDYVEYQKWLTDGGVPEPYAPPKPQPEPLSTEDVVFFNHENRLLALEGKPPMTMKDFVQIKTKLRVDT